MYNGIKSRVVYNCNKTEYFACNVGAVKEKIYFLSYFLSI